MLTKKGHSYEVDIWSIGCILFTLLVGKPPFETQTLKDTYKRIKNNEYHVPSRVGYNAKNLIRKLLQVIILNLCCLFDHSHLLLFLQDDPKKRPPVNQILSDQFMLEGYMPPRLPVSCLTMAPRFDTTKTSNPLRRGPLQELNKDSTDQNSMGIRKTPSVTSETGGLLNTESYLSDLHKQLAAVISSEPTRKQPILEDECEDPKVVPMVWISKWVDYSDKYGFGYALCDESIGVVFNDLTKLLMLSDQQ